MKPQEFALQEAGAQPSNGIPRWLVLIEGVSALLLGRLLLAARRMTTLILVQFIGFSG
jgi:uncharacterized membrane protein HdeD (DUF308 family)